MEALSDEGADRLRFRKEGKDQEALMDAGTNRRNIWIIAGAIVVVGVLAAGAILITRSDGASRLAGGASFDAEAPQDRAAQSSLHLALAAAKTMFIDTDDYSLASAEDLPSIEPSLDYVSAEAPSTGPHVVSVMNEGPTWAGAARSDSGTCFWIMDDATRGTFYGSGEPCTGQAAMGAANPSW